MKHCYEMRAWNICQVENGKVVNGEKVFRSYTFLIAAIKYIYALFMYDYIECREVAL